MTKRFTEEKAKLMEKNYLTMKSNKHDTPEEIAFKLKELSDQVEIATLDERVHKKHIVINLINKLIRLGISIEPISEMIIEGRDSGRKKM